MLEIDQLLLKDKYFLGKIHPYSDDKFILISMKKEMEREKNYKNYKQKRKCKKFNRQLNHFTQFELQQLFDIYKLNIFIKSD